MRKLVLVVHVSLDGFVAGPKGELDGFDAGEENLEFVCGLTKDADAALFGRLSYEMINGHWPTVKDNPDASWNELAYSCWYNRAKKFVVSTTMREAANAIVIHENIESEIGKLKQQPGKNILLFGSPKLARALMQWDLIDDYWIFVNPVTFQDGIPLFNNEVPKRKLLLLDVRQLAFGELAMHYIPKPK